MGKSADMDRRRSDRCISIENIFADVHVMNSLKKKNLRGLFFALGARENGLGARPHFLYAGKTLRGYNSS